MTKNNTPNEITNILKNNKFTFEKDDRYKYVYYKGVKMFEHRAIWIESKGLIPKGFVIHHKNNDKKDNRIDNLECLHWRDHIRLHKNKNL